MDLFVGCMKLRSMLIVVDFLVLLGLRNLKIFFLVMENERLLMVVMVLGLDDGRRVLNSFLLFLNCFVILFSLMVVMGGFVLYCFKVF